MARRLLCLCLVLLGAPAARASDAVFLEELTWTELRDQIDVGRAEDAQRKAAEGLRDEPNDAELRAALRRAEVRLSTADALSSAG